MKTLSSRRYGWTRPFSSATAKPMLTLLCHQTCLPSVVLFTSGISVNVCDVACRMKSVTV